MESIGKTAIADQLVLRAGQGEQSALSSLLDILRGEMACLIRQARVRTNDHEDAAQESVLVVMACAQAYQPAKGSFRSFAFTSLWRMLQRFRRAPFLTLDSLPPVPYAHPFYAVEATDLLNAAPHPDIVRDYYGLGCQERTVNQIAAQRRMAPATVRAALQESIEAMRGA